MFSEHTTSGSDTEIRTHSSQVGNSCTTSLNSTACSVHIFTYLVTSSGLHRVSSSEFDRVSPFDMSSQTLFDKSGISRDSTKIGGRIVCSINELTMKTFDWEFQIGQ